MIFEENKSVEALGEKFGCVSAYFLFTTILYLLLVLLKKIPENWPYLHIMLIALLVAATGLAIKRILK